MNTVSKNRKRKVFWNKGKFVGQKLPLKLIYIGIEVSDALVNMNKPRRSHITQRKW